ncbi:MAG: transporter substrate-binding domain-containing protein [Hahellaceae bacterium]|nr:transporter substrate-binding domain-containing protein [Hahellaceae bacterium]MCP5169770.1 transporter substrate-binding domain-containing protein [Hahellaceae bacterium]
MYYLRILLILLGCSSLHAELLLGVENSWPPFADTNGLGYSTSLVNHAYAAVGIQPRIQVFPYARVLKLVEYGNLNGGYNVTRQPNTESQFLFGSRPLLMASARFYFRNGKEQPYSSLEEVPDHTHIATIIDYEYGPDFEANKHRFQLTEVSSQEQIIQMILTGRVDTGLMFEEVAHYTVEKMKAVPGKIHSDTQALAEGRIFYTSKIYVAFDKHNPENLKYAQLLDEGLRLITLNGVYQQILDGKLK